MSLPGTFFRAASARPAKWQYAIWYLFLASWMHGMAVLNISWGLLLLAALPHFPAAWRKIQRFPKGLVFPIAAYEVLRLLSTIFAMHPKPAWIGMFDDFRYLIVALCAIVFIQTKQDLRHAVIASFIGFLTLAWSSLWFHLEKHPLWLPAFQAASNLRYGSFGHVNYAAAWSAVAAIAMLVAFLRVPFRWKAALIIALFPIILLQAPLNSRATIIALGIAFLVLILWHRQWKSLLLIGGLVGLLFVALERTGTIQHMHPTLSNGTPIPSLSIRWEIFHLIAHLVQNRPLGLGPRNHGFVDLNAHRRWIAEHMPETLRHLYRSSSIDQLDLNDPYPVTYDPHSQYASTLAETGWLGLIALLWLWGALAWYAFSLCRQPDPWKSSIGETALGMLWIYASVGFTVTLMHQPGGVIFFLMTTLVGLSHAGLIQENRARYISNPIAAPSSNATTTGGAQASPRSASCNDASNALDTTKTATIARR